MKSLKRDGSSRNQYCRHWSVADEQDVDTSTLHHGVINSTINSYRHKFQICLQKLRSRDYRKNCKVLQGQLQEHHKLLQDCCLLQRPKRLTQVRSIRVGCNDVARWLRSLYEIEATFRDWMIVTTCRGYRNKFERSLQRLRFLTFYGWFRRFEAISATINGNDWIILKEHYNNFPLN